MNIFSTESTGRNFSLDVLRSLALFLVVMLHTLWTFGFNVRYYLFSVPIFIFISAILIGKKNGDEALTFRGFFLQRIVKLAYVYYVVIFAFCVLFYFCGIQNSAKGVLSALFFLNGTDVEESR
jgi:peptidoglycan/LPS O-acetylase OafA/YrhL